MRKTVLVSDLTQEEITEPATIKVVVGTAAYELDVDTQEPIVRDLIASARKLPSRKRAKA